MTNLAIILLSIACVANSVSIILIVRKPRLLFPESPLTKSDLVRANRLQEFANRCFSSVSHD